MRVPGFIQSDAPMCATWSALAHMDVPAPAPALKLRMLGMPSANDLAPTVTVGCTYTPIDGFMFIMDGVYSCCAWAILARLADGNKPSDDPLKLCPSPKP